GLVLAIGIVVDDAIVVVENVERNIAAGHSPREAAIRSMDEVGGALIAIALVLCAVFIPSAFITGITGQFYRQFALTIAGSTVISLMVSLTLSPAMCMLVLYAGVIALGLNEFRKTPQGFIPQQDRTYLIVVAQLPPGASLARTDALIRHGIDIALDTPGVGHAFSLVGFSAATFTNAPNAGAIFVILDPFEKRAGNPNLSALAIQRALFAKYSAIKEAFMVVGAP